MPTSFLFWALFLAAVLKDGESCCFVAGRVLVVNVMG